MCIVHAYRIRIFSGLQFSFFTEKITFGCTANIYSGKWDTRKKCKSYKYLPSILQCKSVDITVNHCKSLYLEQ